MAAVLNINLKATFSAYEKLKHKGMSESNEKLTRIANLLSHEDIDLALRLLLDEVYDTDDINLYEQALDIVRSRETGIDDKQVKSMLLELIDTLTKQDPAPLDEEKVYIDLTGITKKYAGNSPFRLGPVDLQAKARYIVGLVGENGNGKTTLLRIIAQDLTSTSGSIRYDIGYEGDSLYTLRSMMAYVPQRTAKWFGTLKDNLRFTLACHKFPADEIEARMLMMIARLGLWQYQDLKWKELSSGYKMRFELARVLLTRPKVLILDEPLANLDIFSQQIILEDIKNMAQANRHPMTVLLSSQQLYEVEKHSDEVIFLKQGKHKGTVNKKAQDSDNQACEIVIEIDCSNSREELMSAFAEYSPKIEYNGGMHIVHLKAASMKEVWKALEQGTINALMVRDITKSTRRFFSQ